jgi:voltage-gated potassium channel
VSHRWLRRLFFPLALLAIYFLVPVNTDEAPVGVLLGILVSAAALLAVAFIVFREAMRSQGRLEVIHLVLALELVLVVFSFSYYILAINDLGQMVGIKTRLDALYFSATTVSTVGYGDIHAAGQWGRGLVTLNILFNLAFVAALVNLIREKMSSSRVHGSPDRASTHHSDQD